MDEKIKQVRLIRADLEKLIRSFSIGMAGIKARLNEIDPPEERSQRPPRTKEETRKHFSKFI